MPTNAGTRAFQPGSRCLLRGLQSLPSLNGTIVELCDAKHQSSAPEGRVAVLPVDQERERSVMAVKHENLVATELDWEEEEKVATCKTFMGATCYSNTKLFIFGGMEQCGDGTDDWEESGEDESEEELEMGNVIVGDLDSYDVVTKQWTTHWYPGLPPRTVHEGEMMAQLTGDDMADFSVGPPWRERSNEGALFHWTDAVGGRDLLIFYCSPPNKSEYLKGGSMDGAPCSFDLDDGENGVDCIWIFRFPEVEGLKSPSCDLGYWVKVPTTGLKPTTTLKGKQLEGEGGNRDVRAALYLDPSDDGVRVILWGGIHCPPQEKEGDARCSVAMNGLFELHIPSRHLGRKAGSPHCPPPKWSLLPQRGSFTSMARYDHSLTRVGRDLVVLGGKSVVGQAHENPNDAETEANMGNWAYNIDSHEWRRLEFTPFGPARKPLECISDHLAFAVSHNRVIVVRQFDDIYRHAVGDDDLDNLVLVYDLDNMTTYPLSTFSSSHNMRLPHDKNAAGRPLLGLGMYWFHCGIFHMGGATRLLVHGRVTRDEGRRGNTRYGVSWKYDGSLYSAGLPGISRPRYEYDERTPDWCRPGWIIRGLQRAEKR